MPRRGKHTATLRPAPLMRAVISYSAHWADTNEDRIGPWRRSYDAVLADFFDLGWDRYSRVQFVDVEVRHADGSVERDGSLDPHAELIARDAAAIQHRDAMGVWG